MTFTKLNENYNIQDTFENIKVTGNLSTASDSFNANLTFNNVDDSYIGNAYISNSENVTITVSVPEDNYKVVLHYIEGILDSLKNANDSSVAA